MITNKGGKQDAVRCRMDIFNSASICLGPSRYFPELIATCAGTLWSLVARGISPAQNTQGDAVAGRHDCEGNDGAGDVAGNSLIRWTRWSETGLTPRQFADILKETICHKKTRAADVEAKLAINERRLNWLLERFNEEKAELGSTMWGAYNALTHYATHLPMESVPVNTNREMVASRRNNEVRTVIDWLALSRRGRQYGRTRGGISLYRCLVVIAIILALVIIL